MINAGFVDFAFTGVALVPSLLMMAGHFAEALLLLVPMLIAACLLSLYCQQIGADEADPAAEDESEDAATSAVTARHL